MTAPKMCKDCKAEGKSHTRPAVYPGPRCYTHHLAEKRRIKKAIHDRKVRVNYALSGEDYDAIKDYQGGKCFICQQATGAARALAVDHDHYCDQGHDPKKGCRKCVRALLCKRCNRLVAFLGVEALCRAIEVLTDPPAQKVLR